jgi:hypothetical protein
MSRGIFVQEQDLFGDFHGEFFLQNVLQLYQQRYVILCVDSLALWKIINEEDAVLIPKNRGENFSSGYRPTYIFSDTPGLALRLICCLNESVSVAVSQGVKRPLC